MAAIAMNWRLVNPVSNTKLSWIARSMASAGGNMDAEKWGGGDLVERTQGRHRPPGAVAPEAGHPQLGDRARVLRQGDRAVVELDQLNPSGVQVIEQAGLAERGAHPEHGGVL